MLIGLNEIVKLENQMAFYFKITKKGIVMTKKDAEDFKNNNNCRFCEKNIESDKYRGLAHSLCNINVTQKQSNFIPFIFHSCSKYGCHMFFKKLDDQKNDKVKFDINPKTNEEYISVTYGCIDSYRFISSSLDSLVKTLVDSSHKTLKNLKLLIMMLY